MNEQQSRLYEDRGVYLAEVLSQVWITTKPDEPKLLLEVLLRSQAVNKFRLDRGTTPLPEDLQTTQQIWINCGTGRIKDSLIDLTMLGYTGDDPTLDISEEGVCFVGKEIHVTSTYAKNNPEGQPPRLFWNVFRFTSRKDQQKILEEFSKANKEVLQNTRKEINQPATTGF